MATNDPNWSELVDVALFEPQRVNLRRRIEDAEDAIHRRMKEILKENKNREQQHLGTRCTAQRVDNTCRSSQHRLCPEA
jgi:hypothetical protein